MEEEQNKYERQEFKPQYEMQYTMNKYLIRGYQRPYSSSHQTANYESKIKNY